MRRNERRVETGIVTSDRMQKTVTVQIRRLVEHPRFGKYLRRDSILKVHDEKGEAKAGDVVEVAECRRISKTKNWRLLRVLKRQPTT